MSAAAAGGLAAAEAEPASGPKSAGVGLREKLFGCIAGCHVGSSMGAAVQGWPSERIEKEYGTPERLLPYEEEEEDENGGTPVPQSSPAGRGKRKPWRYRWPDEFRDEILARLLELNKQRAEEERLSGQAAEPVPRRGNPGGRSGSARASAKGRQRREQEGDAPGLLSGQE